MCPMFKVLIFTFLPAGHPLLLPGGTGRSRAMPTSGSHVSGRTAGCRRPSCLPVPWQEDELLHHDAPHPNRPSW